jgi:hypothetical protein
MVAFLTLLAPLALKLIDLWLDKSKANAALRKKFLDLVDEMGKQKIITEGLRKSYYEKRQALEKKTMEVQG